MAWLSHNSLLLPVRLSIRRPDYPTTYLTIPPLIYACQQVFTFEQNEPSSLFSFTPGNSIRRLAIPNLWRVWWPNGHGKWFITLHINFWRSVTGRFGNLFFNITDYFLRQNFPFLVIVLCNLVLCTHWKTYNNGYENPNNKTFTINCLTDFGHAISFFLVEYKSKKHNRFRTEQRNLSQMGSFSMCVVPSRAGHKLSVASDFLTSYRLKRCLPNPHKPCSIMT